MHDAPTTYDLAGPEHDYPYATRAYTTAQIGGNRTDFRRLEDVTDEVLPRGEHRTHAPELRGIAVLDPEFTPYIQARELYTMRTSMHLYDERTAEQTIDLWRVVAKRDGHLLADCHHCRMTHGVAADTTTCPTCGREL